MLLGISSKCILLLQLTPFYFCSFSYVTWRVTTYSVPTSDYLSSDNSEITVLSVINSGWI